MPLNGMTLLIGGTVSATGGTSKTYTTDGQVVPSGIHLIDASVSDYRTRPNCTVKYKPPTLKSDGSYTKAKHSMVLVFPFIDSRGMTHFNLCRCEIEVHPEAASTIATLRSAGAQVFTDVDTDQFWTAGSAA